MSSDERCVNELRVLSCEMITNAKSGHPGIALGAAPILYSLYANVLAVSPNDDKNINRDRFVLSAGHGSSILYATMHAMGFDISKEDLQNFRKINSKTPGHPEAGLTSGVDASTGPLGQGVSNAVGMAIAEKHFEALFNKSDCKVFDSKIFCLVGDGCLMEGISYEALSLAGNLCLDNLVLIYDCNKITIEGRTEITFNEDIQKRFESIGFEIFNVQEGNNVKEITSTLQKAKKSKKPSVVVVPTVIGYGSCFAGNQKVHGTPLTYDQLEELELFLDVKKQYFELSNEAKEHFEKKKESAQKRFEEINKLEVYKTKYPKDYKLLKSMFEKHDYQREIEKIKQIDVSAETTRDMNFEVQNKVSKILPNLFGGSADVATSTKAYVKFEKPFSKKQYTENYIHYGVREHAMAGISNGLALFGGLLPYQSCFLSFVDYLKPALRMSALQNLKILSVFSHDSITAGQDGPTHQPVEQLPSLRLIPNTIVSRPYNTQEILATYIWLLQKQKPVCMLVSKDKTKVLSSDVEKALCGGYVIKENKKAKLTIISTGGDIDRCLKAVEILSQKGIYARVVSMPCLSVFTEQAERYKNSVLGKLPKVFVEASAENIWYKFADKNDLIISLNTFGKSGSLQEVLKEFGFDENSLSKKIESWYKKLNK